MTKYIQIEDESDFIFLRSMFDRAIGKIKANASRFDIDQAETIIRIHESLYNAKDEAHDTSDKEQVSAIKEENVTKKRISKNPKSVRKSSKPPKMRLNLCEEHPYYGAVRSPQHDCSGCWSAYKSLNPNAYEKKRRDFERKMSKELK